MKSNLKYYAQIIGVIPAGSIGTHSCCYPYLWDWQAEGYDYSSIFCCSVDI